MYCAFTVMGYRSFTCANSLYCTDQSPCYIWIYPVTYDFSLSLYKIAFPMIFLYPSVLSCLPDNASHSLWEWGAEYPHFGKYCISNTGSVQAENLHLLPYLWMTLITRVTGQSHCHNIYISHYNMLYEILQGFSLLLGEQKKAIFHNK